MIVICYVPEDNKIIKCVRILIYPDSILNTFTMYIFSIITKTDTLYTAETTQGEHTSDQAIVCPDRSPLDRHLMEPTCEGKSNKYIHTKKHVSCQQIKKKSINLRHVIRIWRKNIWGIDLSNSSTAHSCVRICCYPDFTYTYNMKISQYAPLGGSPRGRGV
jgi:hypothetical protein